MVHGLPWTRLCNGSWPRRRSRASIGDYVPRHNSLTKKPTVADCAAVIDAVAGRDQARVVVDGLIAANDLGLTTAVPARILVLTDARLRPITLGRQIGRAHV